MQILPGNPTKNADFTPPESDFYWGTPLKRGWARFGLVLSSNWMGFVVKTWQPWEGNKYDTKILQEYSDIQDQRKYKRGGDGPHV